jgi:hypothetical protein
LKKQGKEEYKGDTCKPTLCDWGEQKGSTAVVDLTFHILRAAVDFRPPIKLSLLHWKRAIDDYSCVHFSLIAFSKYAVILHPIIAFRNHCVA